MLWWRKTGRSALRFCVLGELRRHADHREPGDAQGFHQRPVRARPVEGHGPDGRRSNQRRKRRNRVSRHEFCPLLLDPADLAGVVSISYAYWRHCLFACRSRNTGIALRRRRHRAVSWRFGRGHQHTVSTPLEQEINGVDECFTCFAGTSEAS